MRRGFHDLLEYALARGSELGFAQHRLPAVDVCAASAQWHVLGFIHINLVSASRETLRLHLWRHGLGREPLWRVHNHSYELTSLVVAGCLEDRRFNVVPDPNAPHQLYEVRYSENGSKRIKLGRRVRCTEVGRFERATDETYGIPLDSFHSSLLTTDWPAAVTIVQTSRRRALSMRLSRGSCPAGGDPPPLPLPRAILVVAGRLEDRRFNVVPDPNAPHQLYEVRYSENGSKRIKLGRRVRCTEVGRFERATDETYGIPLDSFHSSLLTTDWPAAVTIVQTSRLTESPPRVVGTADGAQVYDYVTRAVDAATLDEWSRFISDELRLW